MDCSVSNLSVANPTYDVHAFADERKHGLERGSPLASETVSDVHQTLQPRSPSGVHRGPLQQAVTDRQTASGNVAPSSRAAGKQPMQSSNMQSPLKPSVTQPPAAPSNRSARAAGKAPINPSTGVCQQTPSNQPSTGVQSKSGLTANPKIKPGPSAPAPVRVWQTSTTEERERIKFFWQGLPPLDRRRLVRTEKDAVLKRMKDYQRHACNCSICGRKRITIENELQVLYEAYETELELYEARHHRSDSVANEVTSDAASPGPFPGSVEVDSTGNVLHPDYLAPLPYLDAHTNDRNIGDSDEDYDEDDDEYDEEDEDELEDEEDLASNEADQMDDDLDTYDNQTGRDTQRSSIGSRAKVPHTHASQQQNHSQDSETPDFASFQGDLSSIKGKPMSTGLVANCVDPVPLSGMTSRRCLDGRG